MNRSRLALLAALGLALLAASPAQAAKQPATRTATVLSVNHAKHVARLVWGAQAHRVSYSGTLPRTVKFGSLVTVSGSGERKRVTPAGKARLIRVRGKVVSVRGKRGLRLADKGLLNLPRKRTLTASAAATTVSSGPVSVTLEGFPVGLPIEVTIRFAADGTVNVGIRMLSCCEVPDKPKPGDKFKIIGEYDPETTSDEELTRDQVVSVSAQLNPLDSIVRHVFILPYPSSFRSLVRKFREGDLVRVEGHMRAFNRRIDPPDWEEAAREQGGIWVADRIIAVDGSVDQRPTQTECQVFDDCDEE
jgi:hypothetical protein